MNSRYPRSNDTNTDIKAFRTANTLTERPRSEAAALDTAGTKDVSRDNGAGDADDAEDTKEERRCSSERFDMTEPVREPHSKRAPTMSVGKKRNAHYTA